MTTSCPISFDVSYLREQVRSTYEQLARDPAGDYHFHRGADYAHRFLGYDADELAALPELSTARFAGVGNPLAIGIDMTAGMVECAAEAARQAGLADIAEF